eukprot:CAMPEP_0172891038 /NCGR_PEP_ID=MMETSP1075-20121228/142837_1 /TAXON_ID=2916 /ORGANISM="Ceratium fusus, Strain PA161109" /LENGTH=45 /DNA_ID= /DNA_START= /DNA_END= /DNA_ORIENTATION=
MNISGCFRQFAAIRPVRSSGGSGCSPKWFASAGQSDKAMKGNATK